MDSKLGEKRKEEKGKRKGRKRKSKEGKSTLFVSKEKGRGKERKWVFPSKSFHFIRDCVLNKIYPCFPPNSFPSISSSPFLLSKQEILNPFKFLPLSFPPILSIETYRRLPQIQGTCKLSKREKEQEKKLKKKAMEKRKINTSKFSEKFKY